MADDLGYKTEKLSDAEFERQYLPRSVQRAEAVAQQEADEAFQAGYRRFHGLETIRKLAVERAATKLKPVRQPK